MKRYLYVSLAAVAAMVSCERENGQVQGTEPQAEPREVTVVAEASQTRTLLSGDAVLWESGDAVMLLFTPEEGTGLEVRTEEFTTSTSGATATFTGLIPGDVKYASDGSAYRDELYMVYPATAMNAESGAVSFRLDAERQAAPGSFPSGMNLSSALVSLEALDNMGTDNAVFHNAFSIIRFTLPAGVRSLKVIGTDNLAGEAAFRFGDDALLVVDSWDSESKTVTVTPAESTAFAEGEVYNILVYPGTHSSITVELTDVDGCTYSKTVTETWKFLPAKYYTFYFNTDFSKDFNFTVAGVTIPDNDKVQAVFTKGQAIYAYEVPVAGGMFSVSLSHEVQDVTGYAVYPSTSYSDGKINYDLSPNGIPEALYSAVLDCSSPSATFNHVASALSSMRFTVPEEVKKVNVNSTVAFAGKTEMTVGPDGRMTAGTGDLSEFDFSVPSGEEICLSVYPFTGADITITLIDASGAVNVQEFANKTVAAGSELTLDINQDIEFKQGGSFVGDDFIPDGGVIEL